MYTQLDQTPINYRLAGRLHMCVHHISISGQKGKQVDTFYTDGEKPPQDDWVITPVSKHLTHAMCVMCNEIKPIKLFKHRLTLEETAKRLDKNIATTRMEVNSKYCTPCRKKAIPRKSLRQKSRDEIKRAVAYGDLNIVQAKIEIAKRDEDMNLKKSAGVKRRWERIRNEKAKAYGKILQNQINRKASYYHANKHNGADTTLITFAQTDYTYARIAKQTLLRGVASGEISPQTTKLEDAYTYEQRQELQRLKALIPHSILVKQRRRKA